MVWAALISTHKMYDIFSTCTRVPRSVSIHNLRTIAPRYGELLALLVYLTPRIHLQRTIVLVFARYELRPWLSPRQSIPFRPRRVRGASHRRRPGIVYAICRVEVTKTQQLTTAAVAAIVVAAATAIARAMAKAVATAASTTAAAAVTAAMVEAEKATVAFGRGNDSNERRQ